MGDKVNGRSPKNRKILKVLKARIYEIEKEKQMEDMKDLEKDKKKIEWGSQIRSYVMHPYRMVKDLRTQVETGNVDAVMDGDLGKFIEAFLLQGTSAPE